MNRRRTTRLAMPHPCTADFEQMADVGNGRFCDRCNKTVHDLSSLPDGVLRVFLNAPQRVCMRLHEDQLGRDIVLVAERSATFNTTGISLCLLNDLMPGSLLNLSIHDDTLLKGSWLAGFLIDTNHQRPLVGAIIAVGTIGLAFSDAAGWFKLFVPKASTAYTGSFSVSLNTHADNYQEIFNQSIQITGLKVQLNYATNPFIKPTSVKVSGACTFIQTSAPL